VRISLAVTIYVMALLMCFDSLVKVDVFGLYIQAGVFFSILILVLMGVDRRYKFRSKVITKDRTIIIFFLLIGASFPLAINIDVYFKMVAYFIMFAAIYIYISEVVVLIDVESLSAMCLIILCMTGVVQYLLVSVFSVQMELRGITADHYYYIENRMRGFFLEPNWYGLILFSWLFVYMRSLKRLSLMSILLISMAIVCLFLSENRLIYLFSAILIFLFFCGSQLRKYRRVIPLLVLLLSGGLFIYLSVAGGLDGDRSAAARFYTGYNVISTMLSSSFQDQVIGKGFSNWGWYSNDFEFSWSNYLFDQPLTRRDNSEIYVIFFEMGYLGVMLFIYDSWFLSGRENANTLDVVFLICMCISGMFYPIYQFLMYMVPMMIVRSRVVDER